MLPDSRNISKPVNWDSELRKATLKGKINEMQVAIKRGANIHQTFQGAWTYLHLAARNEQVKASEILIHHGCNVNTRKGDGATPLHVACSAGYASIAKLLVENNIDIRARNKHGDTALHIASNFGHAEIVKYLLETEPPHICRNNNGSTPIHLAAANGHVKVLSTLLNFYFNNNNEVTIPTVTRRQKNLRSGKTSINNNDNNDNNNWIINAVTANGNTPLHMAYFFNKQTTIDYLIKSGADISILNKDGRLPCDVTRFRKRKHTTLKSGNLSKRNRKNTLLRRRTELPLLPSNSVISNSGQHQQNMVKNSDDAKTNFSSQTKEWKNYAKYLNAILKKNNLFARSFENFNESHSNENTGPESPYQKSNGTQYEKRNRDDAIEECQSKFPHGLSPLKKINKSPFKNKQGSSMIEKINENTCLSLNSIENQDLTLVAIERGE
jgi:ankyrin repeat protein